MMTVAEIKPATRRLSQGSPTRLTTTQSILERVAAGDTAAVSECLDRYGDLVWSLARRYLRNATDAEDAVLCDVFARNAVHAAMAGKTGLVIGHLHDLFIHIPIDKLSGQQKRVDPDGTGWQAVLSATGQPARMM